MIEQRLRELLRDELPKRGPSRFGFASGRAATEGVQQFLESQA